MCVCCGTYCVLFKQKTAYEMRIRDWSSDVCSSDLLRLDAAVAAIAAPTCADDIQRCALRQLGIAIEQVEQTRRTFAGRAGFRLQASEPGLQIVCWRARRHQRPDPDADRRGSTAI